MTHLPPVLMANIDQLENCTLREHPELGKYGNNFSRLQTKEGLWTGDYFKVIISGIVKEEHLQYSS